jgi:hypothetical protein
MGECGCGDNEGLVQFAGPDGYVYVLDILPGCPDCRTGPAVQIIRLSQTEAELYSHYTDRLPRIFAMKGHIDWEVFTVVCPESLRRHLDAFHEEHVGEYGIEGFIHDAAPRALRRACCDAVSDYQVSGEVAKRLAEKTTADLDALVEPEPQSQQEDQE